MDMNTVAGAASAMQLSQTQQSLSVSMIKMNADAQNNIADMIMEGSQNILRTVKNADYGFSVYV